MLRRIIHLYLLFLLLRAIGFLIIFSASILFLITLSPFKLLLFPCKLIVSLLLAFYTMRFIKELTFKNFLWKVEKANPFLKECLISYYELRKEKGPFSNLLKKRLEKNLKQKIRLDLDIEKEFRTLAFATIFSLLMLILFPSKYSGLERIKTETLSPSFTVTTTDSTTVFKSKKKVAFYVRKHEAAERFIKKDSILDISFKEPGRYYIWGTFKNKSTLPSIAKVVKKPEIDSFLIITPRGVFKNQKWLVVQTSTEITILLYSKDSNITIYKDDTQIKNGKNAIKVKFKIHRDVTLTAELTQGSITRKVTVCNVSSLPNLPPKIFIDNPAQLFSYVPEDMQLNITGKTYDEDGVKVLYLNYFLKGVLRRVKFIPSKGRDVSFSFKIDLSKEGMLPGDQFIFYVLAEDFIGAVDSTESYYVIFPTLEEIYKEEVTKVSETAFKFTEGVKEFSKIHGKLEEFGDSLKLGIKETEKIGDAVQNLVEDIYHITKEFENILETLTNTSKLAISPELMEKMRVIGEELYNLLQHEFPELEKKIQELKHLSYPENIKKWEEIQKQSSEILERLSYLERIIEMAKKELVLKEIESKIEELVAKREKLIEMSQYSDISQVEAEESKLQSDFDSTFNDLQSKIKETGVNFDFSEPGQRILKKQSQILNSARSKNRKALTKLQNEQLEDLKGLLRSFQNLRESALRQEIEKLLEIIGSIRRALLVVSFSLEENLTNQTYFPYIVRSLERVRVMVRDAGPLILMASSRVPKLLDMAKDSIYSNPTMSLSLINSAIFELFRIQSQASTKDKEGGQSFNAMKFLENLLKKQAQMINESADALSIPMPLPQLQQSLLEKTLELKSKLISMYMSTNNSEVREQIEKALQEIQKTEEKLKKGEIDSELVELQRKTLKHMLDAHGIYKREEFTQKRYAESAKPYEFKPPKNSDLINIEKLRHYFSDLEKLPVSEQKIIRSFYVELLKSY